jgi:hypothetical protein
MLAEETGLLQFPTGLMPDIDCQHYQSVGTASRTMMGYETKRNAAVCR